MTEYNHEQIKRKLGNTLRVFRTKKNSEIIDEMIIEMLERMSFHIIGNSTVRELRLSFIHQNFSDWNNVFKLEYNKKYF